MQLWGLEDLTRDIVIFEDCKFEKGDREISPYMTNKTRRENCKHNVEKFYPYFFQGPLIYANSSTLEPFCMSHALIGQSYMFGLLSVNPSLSSVLRKFRDTGLQRLSDHFGLKVSPPPTTHRILVIMKREADIYSEVAESLCRFVRQRVEEVSQYLFSSEGSSTIEVDCFSPFAAGYNFITEVEKVRQSTIIISEQGTLSYASFMSRDGTNLIAVGYKKNRKDGQLFLFATHFKTTWISTDLRFDERMDAALIRAIITTRFPTGNNTYKWKKADSLPTTPLKDGLYVPSSSYNTGNVNTSIFLILNGTRHFVENVESLFKMGFEVGDIRVIPKYVSLDLLTLGDPITGNEDIRVCKSKINVFLDRIPVIFETITLGGSDGAYLQNHLDLFCRKHQINNPVECDKISTYHLENCKRDVLSRAQLKDGMLVKSSSANIGDDNINSIFLMLNGTRRLVENFEALINIGLDVANVRDIPKYTLELLDLGDPLTGNEDIHVCRTPIHFSTDHTSAIFETITLGEIDSTTLQIHLSSFCWNYRLTKVECDSIPSYHLTNCRNEMQLRKTTIATPECAA